VVLVGYSANPMKNTAREKEWFDDDSFWRELYPFMFPEKRIADARANCINSVSVLRSAVNSLELCVLRLGLPEDGDIGIGVFPQREKILVSGACFERIALERVGTPELQMSQRTDGFIQNNPAMVEDFLKLCRCFSAFMDGKIGFSSHETGYMLGQL
jgi:hypothetical protein